MQDQLVTKYGSETLKKFWSFIDELSFDGSVQEVATVRSNIMKKLTPATSDVYKDIADELAFSLYRNVYNEKKSVYLYAAFDAVAKGKGFYDNCWKDPLSINPLVEGLDQYNNFSNVLPSEGDYYVSVMPSVESVLDDYDDYDYRESFTSKAKDNRKSNDER